jgi:hypothetical protein
MSSGYFESDFVLQNSRSARNLNFTKTRLEKIVALFLKKNAMPQNQQLRNQIFLIL